eukprot:s414_g25.t2
MFHPQLLLRSDLLAPALSPPAAEASEQRPQTALPGNSAGLRVFLAQPVEDRWLRATSHEAKLKPSTADHQAQLTSLGIHRNGDDHQIHTTQDEAMEISSQSSVLLRQHFARNLNDRIHTRPFLSLVEKKWLSFQALAAVCQAHSAGVAHGDLKTENFFISSWSHVILTDFGTFKPLMLPQDDPTEFSFFFESDRNRHRCYLAPERFEGSGGAGPSRGRFSRELAAMDIFSLGCVLSELFQDGQTLLDLWQSHKRVTGISHAYHKHITGENRVKHIASWRDALSAMAKHPAPGQKASDINGSRGCWEEARIFLKDLQEAWPGPNLRTMSLAVPLLAIIWTYRQLPALRVENGSVDHCDPLRTYGEITTRGMHTVSRLAPGGVFLDIGSGHGNFVLWAVMQGGFNESRGIEVVEERHLAALRKDLDEGKARFYLI